MKMKFWVWIFFISFEHRCYHLLASENALTVQNTTPDPPIELMDIGFDGTWQQFCDIKKLDEEFAYYPEHELRVLRHLICDMRAESNITLETMSPFIAYKYCEMMRYQADEILEKLVAKFTNDDDAKKKELLNAQNVWQNDTECYKTAIGTFENICIDRMNPYLRMFKPLLTRVCNSNWLTTENITSYVDEVCVGRKLPGDIDWGAIINTVPYRGEVGTSTRSQY